MKKWVLGLIVILVIASSGLFVIQKYGYRYRAAESKIIREEIGKELDSYKGVKVFNNGAAYAEAYGKNYSKDGYFYGQKWQCVEFIKRFYYDAKEHKMPDVFGNAKDFFDENIRHGEFNKKRGLIQYKNGEDMKPQADDLIVFTDTKYGHVAIITEVTDKDIEFIQQNIYGKTRDKLKLSFKDGKYTIGGGTQRSPAGWLRKEGA